MSIRIFENIPAYRRTRDGYAFTVIKIEISQNCPRHGKCCACVAHHRDHNEGVQGCFFRKKQKQLMIAVLKYWRRITVSFNMCFNLYSPLCV